MDDAQRTTEPANGNSSTWAYIWTNLSCLDGFVSMITDIVIMRICKWTEVMII